MYVRPHTRAGSAKRISRKAPQRLSFYVTLARHFNEQTAVSTDLIPDPDILDKFGNRLASRSGPFNREQFILSHRLGTACCVARFQLAPAPQSNLIDMSQLHACLVLS